MLRKKTMQTLRNDFFIAKTVFHMVKPELFYCNAVLFFTFHVLNSCVYTYV